MLEDLTPPVRVRSCKVRAVLDQLDTKDQEILLAALADLNLWPANALSKALRARDISLHDETISRHRNQMCSCSKI